MIIDKYGFFLYEEIWHDADELKTGAWSCIAVYFDSGNNIYSTGLSIWCYNEEVIGIYI